MLRFYRFTTVLLMAVAALAANEELGQPEEIQEGQYCEQCPSDCVRGGYLGLGDPYWRNDRFAEEQYEETGWPGRREELSDQLSR